MALVCMCCTEVCKRPSHPYRIPVGQHRVKEAVQVAVQSLVGCSGLPQAVRVWQWGDTQKSTSVLLLSPPIAPTLPPHQRQRPLLFDLGGSLSLSGPQSPHLYHPHCGCSTHQSQLLWARARAAGASWVHRRPSPSCSQTPCRGGEHGAADSRRDAWPSQTTSPFSLYPGIG